MIANHSRPPRSIIPPESDHPDRSIHCQEALTPNIRAVADQAVAMGWDKEEITVAIMEIANAWYFDQVAGEKKCELIGK
jgi:hypothetical protein